jgi:hypothetical protein
VRNKIFAVINTVVGAFAILVQSTLLIAVYPKLTQLYKDMGVQVSLTTHYFPILSAIFLAFLGYVVLVAVKLLKSKNPSDSLFKQNLLFTIILLVGNGLFVAFSVMSLINPIYSITNSL